MFCNHCYRDRRGMQFYLSFFFLASSGNNSNELLESLGLKAILISFSHTRSDCGAEGEFTAHLFLLSISSSHWHWLRALWGHRYLFTFLLSIQSFSAMSTDVFEVAGPHVWETAWSFRLLLDGKRHECEITSSWPCNITQPCEERMGLASLPFHST